MPTVLGIDHFQITFLCQTEKQIAAVIAAFNKYSIPVFGCVKNKSLYQDNDLKIIA